MGCDDYMRCFDVGNFVSFGESAADDESVFGCRSNGWSVDGGYFCLCFTKGIYWSDNDFEWNSNDVKE